MTLPVQVTTEQWQLILRLLHEHVPACDVIVFGSRVNGKAKPFSDLDLAVVSDAPMPLAISAALSEAFSESELPFKVDVVDWALASPSFRDVIRRTGVSIREAVPMDQ